MSLLVEIYYTRVLTLFCCLFPWQLYTRHLVGQWSVGGDHWEIQMTQQFKIFLEMSGLPSWLTPWPTPWPTPWLTKIVMSVQFCTLANFSSSLWLSAPQSAVDDDNSEPHPETQENTTIKKQPSSQPQGQMPHLKRNGICRILVRFVKLYRNLNLETGWL